MIEWGNRCMPQQVRPHSREFPDIRTFQTLVTSDASVKSSAQTRQMCSTGIYRPGWAHGFINRAFCSFPSSFFNLTTTRKYTTAIQYYVKKNTEEHTANVPILTCRLNVTCRLISMKTNSVSMGNWKIHIFLLKGDI